MIQLNIPPGSKMCKTDTESIGKYSSGIKFSDLENWLSNIVIMFKAKQYGGEDCDREHVLHVLSFLDREDKMWYHQHIQSMHWMQAHWTFKEVIIGLYNHFVHPSTMQDECSTFFATQWYAEDKGIQGFYDTLIDHAQNMVVYPNDYQIIETFLRGIPSYICEVMLKEGLSPKINMIDDFISESKQHKTAKKTLEYYNRMATTWASTMTKVVIQPADLKKPTQRKVGVAFIHRSAMDLGNRAGVKSQVDHGNFVGNGRNERGRSENL
jgi:hypothetical protein